MSALLGELQRKKADAGAQVKDALARKANTEGVQHSVELIRIVGLPRRIVTACATPIAFRTVVDVRIRGYGSFYATDCAPRAHA